MKFGTYKTNSADAEREFNTISLQKSVTLSSGQPNLLHSYAKELLTLYQKSVAQKSETSELLNKIISAPSCEDGIKKLNEGTTLSQDFMNQARLGLVQLCYSKERYQLMNEQLQKIDLTNTTDEQKNVYKNTLTTFLQTLKTNLEYISTNNLEIKQDDKKALDSLFLTINSFNLNLETASLSQILSTLRITSSSSSGSSLQLFSFTYSIKNIPLGGNVVEITFTPPVGASYYQVYTNNPEQLFRQFTNLPLVIPLLEINNKTIKVKAKSNDFRIIAESEWKQII